ncbi:MAG: hypothetical protein ABIO86_07835 [Sphingomonas sp.]
MTSARTLLVHAGGSKTGTTSLQNFFDLHVDWLEAAGITYHNRVGVRSPFSPTSGNGWPLLDLMTAPEGREAELDTLLDAYTGSHPRGLVSTERFERVTAKGWSALVSRANAAGIRLHLLYYVRDPIPYFLSRYDQAIKRHGETRDFLPWFEDEPWWHLDFLRCLEPLRSEIELTLLHYSTRASDTVANVARLLDLPFAPQEGKRTYDANRSLTERERRVLKYLNAAYGPKAAISLSTFLLEHHPGLPSEKLRDPALDQAIQGRYRDACDWINARYFDGQPVLSARPESEVASPPRTCVDDEIFDRILVDWAQHCMAGGTSSAR